MRKLFAFVVAALVVTALLPWAFEKQVSAYPTQLLFMLLPVTSLFTAATLPLYSLLESEKRVSQPLPTVTVSFFSGAIWFAAFSLLAQPEFSRVGSIVLVQDGAFTSAGWVNAASQTFLVGISAGIAGLCFWAVMRFRIEGNNG